MSVINCLKVQEINQITSKRVHIFIREACLFFITLQRGGFCLKACLRSAPMARKHSNAKRAVQNVNAKLNLKARDKVGRKPFIAGKNPRVFAFFPLLLIPDKRS